MEKVPPPPVDGYAACPLEKAWRCIFDFACKGSIQEESAKSDRADVSLWAPPVTSTHEIRRAQSEAQQGRTHHVSTGVRCELMPRRQRMDADRRGKGCDCPGLRRGTDLRDTWLLDYFAKLEATVVVDIPRYPWQRNPEIAMCSALGWTRQGERASS